MKLVQTPSFDWSVFLKSGVELYVEAGATILGSPDIADYDTSHSIERVYNWDQWTVCLAHLIYAANADNILISGRGTIDGYGRSSFAARREGNKDAKRPWNMIAFVACRNVSVTGVNLVDSTGFTIWPHACKRVEVRGASLRACRAPDRTGTFLQLNGRRTADITAVGNDLSRATIAFASTDDVPANALQQTGNLMR